MNYIEQQQIALFSENLNYLLKSQNKRQIDLINDLGINRSTVSSWCRGSMYPRPSKIKKLADYFGITVSMFVNKNLQGKNEDVSVSKYQKMIDIFDELSDEELIVMNYEIVNIRDKLLERRVTYQFLPIQGDDNI